MTSTRPRRLLAGLAATAAAVAALSAGQAAQAAPTPPAVPTEIAVPDGHKPFLLGHAAGVTDLDLHHRAGRPRLEPGHTERGPSQRSRSRVRHALRRPLLARHRRQHGRRQPGQRRHRRPDRDRMAAAQGRAGHRRARRRPPRRQAYIQRIATTGGLTPPAADCNATTAGAARDVPYTADYLFWKARTS